MKNFVKTVFAVLLGNTIFFGIFFLCFVLFMIGIAISSKKLIEKSAFSINDNTALVLDIKSGLTEMPGTSGSFNIGNQSIPNNIYKLIASIEEAKDDSDIKAILIKMNSNQEISYAQIDLLRKSLLDFKKSKKPIYAYGETVSQKSYYLSSLADKIYINPNGSLDIRGFGAQLVFYKGLLDKLEIEPQIFYAGKFKSATEPFRLNQMSEENKKQTRELLKDVSDEVIANIASDRKISSQEINTSINEMKSNIPLDAKESKLIDGLKYYDEVIDELKKELKEDDVEWLNIKKYASEKVKLSSSGDIAVYLAEGNIVDGKTLNGDGSIGSETFVKDIEKLAKNKKVKGVILRINSPGGSALASSVMLRSLKKLREKKPVVVSMGDVAASGGYYIACETDKVFAEPNTITGSIGVFGIVPNISKMLKNKIGLTFDEVELNDHAVLGINKSLEELEKEKITLEIENVYHTFKTVVSKGRNLPMDSVESLAQGRVWSGSRAKKNGLVNEIGTLQDALAYLADSLDVDKDDYFFYNRSLSDIERMLEDFSYETLLNNITQKILKSSLKEYYEYFQSFYQQAQLKGINTRMYYDIKL